MERNFFGNELSESLHIRSQETSFYYVKELWKNELVYVVLIFLAAADLAVGIELVLFDIENNHLPPE